MQNNSFEFHNIRQSLANAKKKIKKLVNNMPGLVVIYEYY